MRKDNYKIEDRILLKQAACEGCRDSLAIIYNRYQPEVYDYLVRAGADGFAEDICQTVFMRIREGRCNYNAKTAVDNHLCTMAKNILRDHRKNKTEIPYSPRMIEIISEERTIDILSDSLEIAEEHQFLKKLISELPPKSRQAVESVYMKTSRLQNSALENDSKSPDTFRKRVSYAIKLLREKFNGP